MKSVIEAIRLAILDSDRTITEGIKWNTASFYCHGWFATVGVRATTKVQLVLHHGASAQVNSTLSQTIEDPSGLLTWLDKDRATITFSSAEGFKSNEVAFKEIIRLWAKHQALLAETPNDEAIAAKNADHPTIFRSRRAAREAGRSGQR